MSIFFLFNGSAGEGWRHANSQLAPHHNAASGDFDFFAKLILLPTGLHDGGRNKFGANIALAERVFIHIVRCPVASVLCFACHAVE